MSTTVAPISTAGTSTTSPTPNDPVAEAKLAVAHASAEISAIDYELNRLARAKAEATARFNFACQRLGLLNRKEQTT